MTCPTSPKETRPDRNGLRVENHMHPQLTLKLIHMYFLCVLECRYDETSHTLTQVRKRAPLLKDQLQG